MSGEGFLGEGECGEVIHPIEQKLYPPPDNHTSGEFRPLQSSTGLLVTKKGG